MLQLAFIPEPECSFTESLLWLQSPRLKIIFKISDRYLICWPEGITKSECIILKSVRQKGVKLA